MRRFDKHTSDKPSNIQLHNENQKRLNDLIRQREDPNYGTFTPILDTIHDIQDDIQDDVQDTIQPVRIKKSSDNYTPWVIPNGIHK